VPCAPAGLGASRGNADRAAAVAGNVLQKRILQRLVSSLGGAFVAGALLVAVSPLLGSTPARAGNPRSETVQRVYPSAVRIQIVAAGEVVRSASGVAFAAEDARTYVLTNAHVVESNKAWKTPVELRVIGARGGEPILSRVIARGRAPETDLAVIEVPGKLPVTPLSPDDAPELGDDLVVIGAPFGKGLSVAAGIVSQVEFDFAENAADPQRAKAMKTDAAIGYGSSGGGVFDVPRGRLIGLVEGYRTARVAFGKESEQYAFDVPMPGETFVAPAAKIRRFLGENGLQRLAAGSPTAAATPAPVAAPSAPPRG
jgi:serine protease Do